MAEDLLREERTSHPDADAGRRDGLTEEQVRVARFYDDYGTREWLRLEADARLRVIFHVHASVLRRFLRAGDRVLDAGCCPGRFSIELGHLGARVTAGDISPVQVSLARQSSRSHLADGAPHMAQFTVTDLPFADGTFGAAVCYGSVLSHLNQQALTGMRELIRVVRDYGLVLISVQPPKQQPGQANDLAYLLHEVRRVGLAAVDDLVLQSKELPEESSIPWRAFSQQEIESMAVSLNCEVILFSASNVLATVTSIPLLETIEKDPRLQEAFLRWEQHLAVQPGNIERGSHLIAVPRKK